MTIKLHSDARALEAGHGMVWLVEVEVPTEPLQRFRITSNNEPVTFGRSLAGVDNIYYPWPLQVGRIDREKNGNLPQIAVSVSNARKVLPDYLEAHNGFLGQPFAVQLVSLGELENYGAALRFDGEVLGCEVTFEQVNLTVGSGNPRGSMFPKQRFVGEHCRYASNFGGPQCRYQKNHPLATYTSCPGTYAACQARGDDEELVMLVDRLHPTNFGGWRSIPLG